MIEFFKTAVMVVLVAGCSQSHDRRNTSAPEAASSTDPAKFESDAQGTTPSIVTGTNLVLARAEVTETCLTSCASKKYSARVFDAAGVGGVLNDQLFKAFRVKAVTWNFAGDRKSCAPSTEKLYEQICENKDSSELKLKAEVTITSEDLPNGLVAASAEVPQADSYYMFLTNATRSGSFYDPWEGNSVGGADALCGSEYGSFPPIPGRTLHWFAMVWKDELALESRIHLVAGMSGSIFSEGSGAAPMTGTFSHDVFALSNGPSQIPSLVIKKDTAIKGEVESRGRKIISWDGPQSGWQAWYGVGCQSWYSDESAYNGRTIQAAPNPSNAEGYSIYPVASDCNNSKRVLCIGIP